MPDSNNTKLEKPIGGLDVHNYLVILEFSECDTYIAFYSIRSPFRCNPYKHELAYGGHCDKYLRNFNEVILMGVVQQERFRPFLETFYNTRPGPDQYFVLRLFLRSGSKVLLNQSGLEYLAGEREYHYYNLAMMDYLFFSEDLKECGFLVRRRVGEAKMEDKSGIGWRTRGARAQEMAFGMRWWSREDNLFGCNSCLDYSN
ncbi:uncharacterized protein BDW70DRAFT_151842 [Aspergillus foveolatus]|uniref:uncharacterized protein n=1 Tax=Aspergillus foveolatus TaxID=210207 RepID=UPI003CCCD7A0